MCICSSIICASAIINIYGKRAEQISVYLSIFSSISLCTYYSFYGTVYIIIIS